MEDKILDILENQTKLLDNIKTVEDFSAWKEKTSIFLCRIYSENSRQYKQFLRISCYPGIILSTTLPDVPGAVAEARNILQGFIEDIRTFGLLIEEIPKAKNAKSSKREQFNINISPTFNQSQEQNQSQTVNLKDILEDELPRARMKEIETIAKADEPKDAKLAKIGEVLQKTGVEVLSSTLAKIITTSMGIY